MNLSSDTLVCTLPEIINQNTGQTISPDELIKHLMLKQGICANGYEVLPVSEENTRLCIDFLKKTNVTKIRVIDSSTGAIEVYIKNSQTGELECHKNYARVIKLKMSDKPGVNWEDDNLEC